MGFEKKFTGGTFLTSMKPKKLKREKKMKCAMYSHGGKVSERSEKKGR